MKRAIASFLVLSVLAVDPGVGAAFHPEAFFSPAHSGLSTQHSIPFSHNALTLRLAAGFDGEPSITVRGVERRKFLQVAPLAAGVVLFFGLFAASSPAQTTDTKMTAPVRYAELMTDFVETSPELKKGLREIRAAELELEGAMATDRTVVSSMMDLNRAPRLHPLPVVHDVVGRTQLLSEGRLRGWESIRTQRDGFFGGLLTHLQSLASFGGYKKSSANAVLLSRQPIYLAAIGLGEAELIPFRDMEGPWLKLQTGWFDLALTAQEIEQLTTERRFLSKQRDLNRLRVHKKRITTIQAASADDGLLTRIQEIDQQLALLELKRQRLRDLDVLTRIAQRRRTSAVLPPDVRPSLHKINQTLLRAGIAPHSASVRSLRENLQTLLSLDRLPGDPYDPRTRDLILGRLWGQEADAEPIPAASLPGDARYPDHAEDIDRLLSEPEADLLERAQPSPTEHLMSFRAKRYRENADTLMIKTMPQWTLDVFLKLGWPFPLEILAQSQRMEDAARSKFLATAQEEHARSVEPELISISQANDETIRQARSELESARHQLILSTQQSLEWLEKLNRRMQTRVEGAPPTKRELGVDDAFVIDNPAYQFERRVRAMELASLQMEKAYQKVDYLVRGRRDLLEKIDAARRAESDPNASPALSTPAAAPVQRKDLALPEKPSGPSRVRRSLLLGLFSAPLGAAAQWATPLVQLPTAPDVSQWILSAGLVVAMLAMPHLLNRREEDGRDAYVRSWLFAVALLLTATFPFGWMAGAAMAMGMSVLSWKIRPEALTESAPSSAYYKTAHALDRSKSRRTVLKGTAWVFVLQYLFLPLISFFLRIFQSIYQFFTAPARAARTATAERVRFPFTYWPGESGTLVAVHPLQRDASGRYVQKYLVRWIDAGQPAPGDALFVFQRMPLAGPRQQAIDSAQQALKLAEGRLQSAQNAQDQDAVTLAQSDLQIAQSQLANAHAMRPALNEPLPSDGRFELDYAFPTAKPGTEVHSGQPISLAMQRIELATRLSIQFPPDDVATIGAGLVRGAPMLRMHFAPLDGSDPVVIPVPAIRHLKFLDAAPTPSEDPAKGSFRVLKGHASIEITQNLIAFPGAVSQTAVDYLKKLDRGEPVPALKLAHFEQWNGKTWMPFALSLAPNEAVGWASLETLPAGPAAAEAPRLVARAISSGASQAVDELELTRQRLLERQRTLQSDRGDVTAEEELESLKSRLLGLDGQIEAARHRKGQSQSAVVAVNAVGIPIRPRQQVLQHRGALVIADNPIARANNPWQQLHTAASTAPEAPAQVLGWNPQSLRLTASQPVIAIRGFLRTINQIGTPEWHVRWPGSNQSVAFHQSPSAIIDNQTLNRSRVMLEKAVPVPQALSLIPQPASDMPVIVILPQLDRDLAEDPSSSRWTLADAIGVTAMGGGAVVAYKAFQEAARRRTRLRNGSLPPSTEDENSEYRERGQPHRPSYLHAVHRPQMSVRLPAFRPAQLKVMDAESMKKLSARLGGSYFPYEYQKPNGEMMTEEEILLKKLKHTGVELDDLKVHTGFHKFQLAFNYYGHKLLHNKIINVIFLVMLLVIHSGGGADAFEQIRIALFQGNLQLDYLASYLGELDLASLFTFNTLVRNPMAMLNALYPLNMIMALLWILWMAFAKGTAEWTAGTAGNLEEFRYYRLLRVTDKQAGFLAKTRDISCDGRGITSEEAVQQVRLDAKATNEPHRAREIKPEFLTLPFQKFSHMLVERAYHNLQRSARVYLNEKPEMLERAGGLDSPGRQQASAIRWLAAAMEHVAIHQDGPDALIPAGSPFDREHYHYEPSQIDEIARTLGMDLGAFRAELMSLDLPLEEVEERLRRIEQEYRDRALVWWALQELPSRATLSCIVLDAVDLMGVAIHETGQPQADRDFESVLGDIENVLDEWHLRLPTLLERAHVLRAKYSRKTDMFQANRYTAQGFGADLTQDALAHTSDSSTLEVLDGHSLNRFRANRLQQLLINPKTGQSLMRERFPNGVPTFEAVALRLYLWRDWPVTMVTRIYRALRRFRNFSTERATQQIETLQDTLERSTTRRYLAWAYVRRMIKSLPKHFDELLSVMRTTTDRTQYDVRWLADRAPLMGPDKRPLAATNADLLITDLRMTARLEDLVQAGGSGLDIDVAEDMALHKNPQQGAAEPSQFVPLIGRGHYFSIAMDEAMDAYAKLLSPRLRSRVAEPLQGHLDVLTHRQAEELLPRLGQRSGRAVLFVAQEPGNFAAALDPDKTDESTWIVSPPNPWLTAAGKVIAERLLNGQSIKDIEEELTPMGVKVRVHPQWDPGILDEVPSALDDNRYDIIHVLPPNVRPHRSLTMDTGELKPDAVQLEFSTELNSQAARLYGNTTWGGEKSMRYQVREGVEFAETLDGGFHYLMDKEGRLLGGRKYHRHTIHIGALNVDAIYHSWTAVASFLQRRGFGRALAERTLAEYAKLKPDLAYCFIDKDHESSIRNNLSRGYEEIGELVTGTLWRSDPKDSNRVRPAKEEDKTDILRLLNQRYADYALTDFNSATLDPADSYYVYESGGRIQAVVNAKEHRWAFSGLGKGKWLDAAIFALLRYAPVLNRKFKMADLDFLKIADLAFEPGAAPRAVELIEALLYRHTTNTAWGFMDAKGPLYQELRRAGAFGRPGVINKLAETRVGVYAKAFSETGKKAVEEARKKPLSASRSNLSWWVAPFIGLSWLFSLAPRVDAAPVSTAQVVGQAARDAFDVVAQTGSSPWSLAQEYLGNGARYQELIAANPQWAEAGAKIGKPFLFHPGDTVHVPFQYLGTGTTPIDIAQQTVEPSVSAWSLGISPELLWVAAGVALFIAAVWLWRRYSRHRLFARPIWQTAMASLLAVVALAQSVAPWALNSSPRKVEPAMPIPKPAVVRNADVVDRPTLDPVWRSAPSPRPVEAVMPLPEPRKIALVSPAARTTPPALPLRWEATEKLPAYDPVRHWTTSPLLAKPAKSKPEVAIWIDYANTRLIDAAAINASRPADQVELLRQRYMALYALRRAEAASGKPIESVDAVKPPAQKSSPLKKFGRKFAGHLKSMVKLAAKPVIGNGTAALDAYDPDYLVIRAQIIDAIRSVKRQQALTRRLQMNSRAAGDSIQAARYEQLVEAADAEAMALREALLQGQDVSGLPEDERFETTYQTRQLWEQTAADSSRLAEETAAIHTRSLEGVQPVAGTQPMSASQRQAILETKAQQARDAAAQWAKERSRTLAEMETQLSLARHLQWLGLPDKAWEAEERGIRAALALGVLPVAPTPFRSAPERLIAEGSDAQSTTDEGITLISETMAIEQSWIWALRVARAENISESGLDYWRRPLLDALAREATLRAAWRTENLVLGAAVSRSPGAVVVSRASIEIPTLSPLTEIELAAIRGELIAAQSDPTHTDGSELSELSTGDTGDSGFESAAPPSAMIDVPRPVLRYSAQQPETQTPRLAERKLVEKRPVKATPPTSSTPIEIKPITTKDFDPPTKTIWQRLLGRNWLFFSGMASLIFGAFIRFLLRRDFLHGFTARATRAPLSAT